MTINSKLKVAIVHDWIIKRRGAEKCLEAFCEIFPNADVYTLFYKKGVSKIVDGRKVYTSFLQKFPLWKFYYRYLYFLMPVAIERFNLDRYDIVVSSNFCVSKGVITKPETLHVSYVHSPMRYAWDMYEQYFGKRGGFSRLKRLIILPLVSVLRLWDQSSSVRPDFLVSNSRLVKERVKKYWRKDSKILNPPVDVSRFRFSERKSEYFLMVTTFEPNKRTDLAVRAFTELGYPLKIVGSYGRYMKKVKKMAGLNIEFLGFVSDDELAKLYSEAKAYVIPGKEDFGIAPLEAISSGTPVVAYGDGGALDSIIPINSEKEECIRYGAKNGVFFYKRDVSSLKKAVRQLQEYDLNEGWDKVGMRKWAKRFATSNFKSKMKSLVLNKYEEMTRLPPLR
ncbi:MAG: glycosyltransferase [bacterium]